MDQIDAVEQAYINGYNDGLKRAMAMFMRRAEIKRYPLTREDVEQIFKSMVEAE